MIILAVTIQTLSSHFLSYALITAKQSDHKSLSKSLIVDPLAKRQSQQPQNLHLSLAFYAIFTNIFKWGTQIPKHRNDLLKNTEINV